ncbi:MAG: peptidoglycan-binding domain-containing protein [Myxococcales bacterium]|nr:peptidoglycan-binding domain-containing protein [Myxococcales bacterium]
MKRVVLLSLACLVGCAHATKTAAVAKKDPEAKSAAPKNGESKEGEPKKPAAVRDEMSTSATTKAMFKPDGLKVMQKALQDKKVEAIEVTGKFDTQTQEALRVFQKAQTLPDTGLPDFETLRRLGLEPDDVYQPSTPAERLGVQ